MRPILAPEAALAKGSLCYTNVANFFFRLSSATFNLTNPVHTTKYTFMLSVYQSHKISAFCGWCFCLHHCFTFCICQAANNYVCADCPRLDRKLLMADDEGGKKTWLASSAWTKFLTKQTSRTVYVNKKRLLVSYACLAYNKWINVLFFIRGGVRCMFWIIHVSQLTVHPSSHHYLG